MVIAESFERIHRSNLIGMGILPLEFPQGVTRKTLGLTGEEVIDIADLQNLRHWRDHSGDVNEIGRQQRNGALPLSH